MNGQMTEREAGALQLLRAQPVWVFPDEAARFVRENTDNPWNLSVLEAGCGRGRMSITLAKELGCRVRGLDVDAENIRAARLAAQEAGVAHLCAFETADVWRELRGSARYDLVIYSGGLGPDRELPELLPRLKGALALGGKLLLCGAFPAREGALPDELERETARQKLIVSAYRGLAREKFLPRIELERELAAERAQRLAQERPELADGAESALELMLKELCGLADGYSAAMGLFETLDTRH